MASFRKRGPYQWQAQVRRKGPAAPRPGPSTPARPPSNGRARSSTKSTGATYVSRAEAESTNLRKLLERYRDEVTPLKKGAAPQNQPPQRPAPPPARQPHHSDPPRRRHRASSR